LRLRAAGVRPAALQGQGSERPAQQAQQRLAGFPITRCAEDMNPAEQQQAFIVRQFLAIRSRTARNFGADSSILSVHIPTARFGSFRSVATA
jgi:hypothetical protein